MPWPGIEPTTFGVQTMPNWASQPGLLFAETVRAPVLLRRGRREGGRGKLGEKPNKRRDHRDCGRCYLSTSHFPLPSGALTVIAPWRLKPQMFVLITFAFGVRNTPQHLPVSPMLQEPKAVLRAARFPRKHDELGLHAWHGWKRHWSHLGEENQFYFIFFTFSILAQGYVFIDS